MTTPRTRYSRLMEKLYELNARPLGSTPAPNGLSELLMYSVNGRVVIIQHFAKNDAWEIYTPLSPSISVDVNLRALEEFATATI